jgi:hypothetical protein
LVFNKYVRLLTLALNDRGDPSSDRMGGSKFSLATLKNNKVTVEESVTLFLEETSTQMLFHLPSYIVASDTRDVINTDERNARYEAVIESHVNVDGFTSRPTQTKNNQLKNANEMAAPNTFRDIGNQAISYEIKDETSASNASMVEADLAVNLGVGMDSIEDFTGFSLQVKKFITDTTGVAMVTPGCMLDTKSAAKPSAPGEHKDHKPRLQKRRSVASVNNPRASTMVASGEVSDEDNANSNLQRSHVGGASNTSSGNNSNADLNVTESKTAANVSQSNVDGDSNMDSDDGARRVYQAFTEEDSQAILREAEIKKVLSSPMLLKRLHMIERAIQQNANYRAQLDYRDLPDIAPLVLVSADQRAKTVDNNDPFSSGMGGKGVLNLKRNFADRAKSVSSYNSYGLSSDNDAASMHSADNANATGGGPGKQTHVHKEKEADRTIKKLFSYSNAVLVQERSVTVMAWNSSSTDLLAVGYGRTSDILKNPADALNDEAQEGLVLFWSLRNPDYPEKILRTAHNVTALEFSKQHPMILAVGLSNGDVNIYDVKREGKTCNDDSSHVLLQGCAGVTILWYCFYCA